LLLRQGAGVIVNTSSVFGLIGVPRQSAYCASKFAVRGFTDALRGELRGTGVSAVAVHPGGIKTNIARNARFHIDPRGAERTHAQAVQDFEQIARTTPERAAQVIHEGVKAGKARILVGTDAYLIDALARVAPARYADLVSWLTARAERHRA
jgi:short-subunit dehydrogenase